MAGTISICKGDELLKNFPVTGKMTLGYARMTGDGDPFSKYHHYDFDLASSEFTFKLKDITITYKELNVVEFEINGSDFEMTILGLAKLNGFALKLSLTISVNENSNTHHKPDKKLIDRSKVGITIVQTLKKSA